MAIKSDESSWSSCNVWLTQLHICHVSLLHWLAILLSFGLWIYQSIKLSWRDPCLFSEGFIFPSITGPFSSDGRWPRTKNWIFLLVHSFFWVPNSILVLGFRFQVLYLAVKTLLESGHEEVYNAVERPLQFAQSAAFLEILHGLVGELLWESLRIFGWFLGWVLVFECCGFIGFWCVKVWWDLL